MTVTLKTYINVSVCDTEDETTTYFDLDHDLTREDLDEFVKEQGYSDYKSYFAFWIDDEDDLKGVIEDVENEQFYSVELYIIVDCKDEKALKKFIAYKYQNEAVAAFLKQLEDAPITRVEC